MIFEIINKTFGQDVDINEQEYKCIITLEIICTDNKYLPIFSNEIEVISTNDMTGYEVNEQRGKAIDEHLKNLNK